MRGGSCGVPQGFRGVRCGFRVLLTTFFAGVPLYETPPYIILITEKGWPGGANWGGGGGKGVLEFYKAVVMHSRACLATLMRTLIHMKIEL